MTTALAPPPKLADPECDTFKFQSATIGKNVDPAAQNVDCVAYMTTDAVDEDNEIVLPSGCDMSRFAKNRVLMLNHSMGQPGSYYPLPVGTVVDTKVREHGILAFIKFARSSAMGQEIKGLFDEDMLRSFSIGFKSLESSPLTRQEAESRDDWAAAYAKAKGKILVHRRWKLIELSVAPIPCNADALRVAYKSKGIAVPEWIATPSEDPMTKSAQAAEGGTENEVDAKEMDGEVETESMHAIGPGMHVKDAGGSKFCGIVKSIEGDMADVDWHDTKCKCTGKHKSINVGDLTPHEVEAKDLVDPEISPMGEKPQPEPEVMPSAKSAKPPTAGLAEPPEDGGAGDLGGVDKDMEDDVEDEAMEDESDLPVKTNDHVMIKAPHYKGWGVVKSIHRRGHVPHVEEDIRATPESPAAMVKCYKAFGDGHVPTEHHVGAKLGHLSKCEPLKAPTKKSVDREMTAKAAPAAKAKAAAGAFDLLPPLEPLTEGDRVKEALDKITKFADPKNLESVLKEYVDKKLGVV